MANHTAAVIVVIIITQSEYHKMVEYYIAAKLPAV